MSELTLFLIRIAFLTVLWVFVLAAVSVMRGDVFGARVPASGTARPAKPKKAVKQRVPKRGVPTQVVVVEGPSTGERASLEHAPIIIGRGGDAAIQLDDDYVSTRHARIAASPSDPSQWFVEDLGSTNGTYLGSVRIHQPTPIALGSRVRIGKTILELRK